MSFHGDDRDRGQAMHSGATERNGPSQGADLGSEQGDRILIRNETVAPTQEGKEAALTVPGYRYRYRKPYKNTSKP